MKSTLRTNFSGGEIRFRISRSIGKSGFRFWKSKSGFPNRTHPGFSDRWKVVAFDRKLRFGAEPVTRRDTKMAAELKCVNGTRNSVRNVPTGKSGLPFRFSTFSGNFPAGRADETFSTYCRTEISGNFDEMQSALDLRRSFPDRPSDPNFALSPGFSHKAKIKMAAICLISGGFLVAYCLVWFDQGGNILLVKVRQAFNTLRIRSVVKNAVILQLKQAYSEPAAQLPITGQYKERFP